MKILLRIARTELATMFYSPIAWFIWIVFSYICASDFVSGFESSISYRELHGYGYPSSLTYSQFLHTMGGFLQGIVGNLYIYIPLLTMGLLSRETASGSIKLLYSSPVNSSQIVLGKYLATMIFGLCMLMVPVLACCYGSFAITNFDWPPVLVALLGLYLLICAYSAIGLFMSSLTNYQVVAALGTLAVLAVLKFIGTFGQEYDFVREITYWLSLNGRSESMMIGAMRSEDMVYFVAVIAMFLAFTVFRISFSRRTLATWVKVTSCAVVVLLVMTVGYISSRPSMITVWDATYSKINSISENSKAILKKLEGPVTITNYVNLMDNASFTYLPLKMKQNERLFDSYCRAKQDLDIRYVYYYDWAPNGFCSMPKMQGKTLEQMRDYAVMVYNLNPRLFKSPEQMKEIIDLSGEQNTFVRVLETADGRRTYLRDFSDMERQPGEAEIIAAIRKMVETPPVVAFVKGHGEREVGRPGDRDYSSFAIERYSRMALINQGFDVVELNLAQCDTIPQHINILVMAEMRQPLSEAENKVMDEYVARGGNLFILADVGRQEATNPLLARFGLKMEDGILAQPIGDFTPDFILSCFSNQSGEFSEYNEYNYQVSMPECVALNTLEETNGFTCIPLLETRKDDAWIELETDDLKENEVVCNEVAGEKKQRYVTAYLAERKVNDKKQRIIVCGDADCLSNAEIYMQRDGYRSGNSALIAEGFHWLTDGKFPVDVTKENPIDTRFTVTVDQFSSMKMVFHVIIPGLLLILGVFLWIKRHKR